MAAAAAVTATTFTVVVTMVVIVAVAVTAAAAFTVFVVMVVLAVYVAVRQFFGRFADRDNFHVEVQVLAGQHVVAVNHHVVAVNFGDFNRYRALIGVSQETHADLQFVNAHEDVFRYALHQVFVVVAVRVVRADVNVKTIANVVAFECFSRPAIREPCPCR